MYDQSLRLDDLPELPLDLLQLAGTLQHARTAPVLTIRPPTPTAPDAPVAPVPAIKKSQVVIRKYLTQVLFPRVICYPFSDLFAELAFDEVKIREHAAGREQRIGQTRFYKLTAASGLTSTAPYFCTVAYGPWSARVTEEESCTHGVPNRFTLQVIEIPEIVIVWYGEWQDVPPHPLLHVIQGDLYLLDEVSTCCPGFKWCATLGSCIPEIVKCDDPLPV